MDASARRRPGGRTARTTEAVTAATLRQLETVGYERLTIASVASEADVHESTVYRRWHSKPELVATAMLSLVERELPTPNTGTLVTDLGVIIDALVAFLEDPRGGTLVRSLASLADRSDESLALRRRFWATRAEAFRPVIDRAVARGELPAGLDPVEFLEALAGPFYLRFLLTGRPVADDAERMIARVVAGFQQGRPARRAARDQRRGHS